MRKLFFVICLFTGYTTSCAQIVKVEHFNAHSTYAPDLFNLFKTTFKLPVVYDYQEIGNFSSGGIWLGNITLEFVNYNGMPPGKAVFKGIALEPVQHTDTLMRMLDEFGVAYNTPVPARFMIDNVEKTYWTNTVLKDLSPGNVRVFVCDYTDRNFLGNQKRSAVKTFAEQQGGPLGIIGLKKIIIGAIDMERSLQGWVSLPGAKRAEKNHFRFVDGPEIVVEKSDVDGVKEIQLQVRSIEAATKFLSESHMLSVENNTKLIDPEKMYGLRIILLQ